MSNSVFCLYKAYARKTRAYPRVRDFLSNDENGLKRMQNEFQTIWTILKFCARTDARTYACVNVHVLDWNKIDFHHGQFDLKVIFRYEDMTMT